MKRLKSCAFLTTALLMPFTLPAGTNLTLMGEAPYSVSVAGPVPVWTGGALVRLLGETASASPVVHRVDQDGRDLPPYSLSVPGATLTRIHAASHARDGSLAIVGMSHDSQGRGAGFLALVKPDRQAVQIVNLFPYIPYLVAASDDGSVWTQGLESNRTGSGTAVDQTHGVVRHFDASGKLIAWFLPQSDFSVVDLGLNLNLLSAAKGRAGWYCNNSHKYFEIGATGAESFQGVPIGREGYPTGLALDNAKNVFVSVADSDNSRKLYYLDRSSAKWASAALPPGLDAAGFVLLYGGDGNRLALRMAERPAITFVQIQP